MKITVHIPDGDPEALVSYLHYIIWTIEDMEELGHEPSSETKFPIPAFHGAWWKFDE